MDTDPGNISDDDIEILHDDYLQYRPAEEMLLNSGNFRLNEQHVSEMVGVCNPFTATQCHTCDTLDQEQQQLAMSVQNLEYDVSVVKANNKLLKNKMQQYNVQIHEGDGVLLALRAQAEAARRERVEIEEKIRLKKAAQSQSQSLPGIGQQQEDAEVEELHGVDLEKKRLGYFCLCGNQFAGWQQVYGHFHQLLNSKERNIVVCSSCKQKLLTWSGINKHSLGRHSNSLEVLLEKCWYFPELNLFNHMT